MKRIFDVIVSFLVLMSVLPVMVLVALMIKIDSKGPVIFRQQRVGRHGQGFCIYKFRSMVVDATTQGPHFTKDEDPRITRIGSFIRKTSLDELPQLINVLKGEMSLVGPRPNVSKQREEYTDEEWDRRNSVRPGITGLAQAKLRSAATPAERTSLDLEYVGKVGLLYDLWIIILTVRQVVFKGSH